jgi:ribosomal protein S26
MRAITRTNKNPLVIEYTAPQKIYFTAKLVDEGTGREFKDGILVQSEYSMTKDQKSRYCLIAEIPEKGRNYRLKLFAKNRHSSEDNENTFPMVTEFLVIREGDEENSIPRYNLTFDFGLRVTSPASQYIKFKANPLVMEFEASNNSQTPQNIYFSTKLVEERTNREITNAAVVQSEYAMFKDQKSKYCLIADIPEKGRKYKLQLFAKTNQNSEETENTFPILTEFIVIREGDEESYIPQYNLSFDHDIKLKSHYCQFIKFKTNPLAMEFDVPKHIKTLFKVKTMNDSDIEDAVFSQINPENSKTILQVAIPRKGEKFLLKIFAKHVRDQGNMFGFVSQIFLIRTQSNQNDALKFCKVFTGGQNCFIYSPIEYYLTSNSLYEFRYFIKDALDVAIIDSSNQWSYLNRYSQDPNTWVLNTALTAKGKANVFAKFDQNSSFSGICYYEVI